MVTIPQALFALFGGKRRMSQEEREKAIKRTRDHMNEIRLPNEPGIGKKYHAFLGEYCLRHPEAKGIDAHRAFMEEYRREKENRPPSQPDNYQPAYSQ